MKAPKPLRIKPCEHCKKEFEYQKKSRRFCSDFCTQQAKVARQNSGKTGMVACAICGMQSHELVGHITRTHKMTTAEYRANHNNAPIRSEKYLTDCATRIQGSNNPGWQHGGKFSALSKNFIHADTTNIADVASKISKSNKKNGNTHTTLLYWTKQGYTEEQARIKLSERQTTFSKEICIAELGREEGTKKWKARQDKWQATLNAKPPKEIERINRAKITNNLNRLGYSKISQELFVKIYNQIKDQYSDIYFATFDRSTNTITEGCESQEFFYISPISAKTFFFDFYIESLKAIIEFDGDYWHGPVRGNVLRDQARDEHLQQNGFRLLHITERDYKTDPEGTLQKCLNFLNQPNG